MEQAVPGGSCPGGAATFLIRLDQYARGPALVCVCVCVCVKNRHTVNGTTTHTHTHTHTHRHRHTRARPRKRGRRVRWGIKIPARPLGRHRVTTHLLSGMNCCSSAGEPSVPAAPKAQRSFLLHLHLSLSLSHSVSFLFILFYFHLHRLYFFFFRRPRR